MTIKKKEEGFWVRGSEPGARGSGAGRVPLTGTGSTLASRLDLVRRRKLACLAQTVPQEQRRR